MKRTILVSLALAATTSALVGAFVIQPPPARASSQLTEPAPTPATGDLLCNLSVGDVADIVDYYGLEPDPQVLAAALATPFDCDAYGELCTVLDTQTAHAFACGAWLDLKAHVAVADVNLNAIDRLYEWTEADECDGDQDFCIDHCGSPGNVLLCSGIDTPSGCRTIVACEDMILRIFLKNLGLLWPEIDPGPG
jgi:hypothetical protein